MKEINPASDETVDMLADAGCATIDDNAAPISRSERLDRLVRRLRAVAPTLAEDDLFDIKANVRDHYDEDESQSD